MSKIALEGNASGTGTFTIASPNSNSNYTLTLPSSTGTLVVTGGAQTIEFAAGTAAAPSITFTGDTNTGIFSPGADTIAFAEGGAEAMRIDSSGNVGVGITPSANWTSAYSQKAIQIGPVGAVSSLSQATGNQQLNVSNNAIDFSTSFKYLTSDLASNYQQVAGKHQWFTAASGTAGNTITFTQAMTLDASGNLGIGTSSPVANNKLTIDNGANAYGLIIQNTGGNDAGFKLAPNGTTQFYFTSNTDGNASMESNGATLFRTNSAERARITSGGNLLVSTTSETGATGSIRTATKSGVWGIVVSDAFGNNALINFLNSSNSQVGSITISGSNTVYSTTSDYRLKHDVQPMTGALSKVTALKPVTYKWNADGSSGEGFIAHELQEVFPSAATGQKDAVETYTDEEGNEQTRPVYQGIDTSFLVATLTAAIQELKAITDAQATRIEALEAEVAALKGQ